MNPSFIDNGMVVLANAFNLLVVAVFIARANELRQVEWVLGIIIALLAFPVVLGIIANITAKREWWTYVLPMFLLSYCALEFVLDYVLKTNFRSTNFLWVYLAMFTWLPSR